MKSETAAKSELTLTPGELVAGIRAGDESAWRAMAECYEPLLRRLARRCGLSAADAQDAVQLTWLRCLEHIDQLTDGTGSTAGWRPSAVASASGSPPTLADRYFSASRT